MNPQQELPAPAPQVPPAAPSQTLPPPAGGPVPPEKGKPPILVMGDQPKPSGPLHGKRRKLLIIGSVLVVILAIVTWDWLGNITRYTQKTVKNDGFTYSFRFDSKAKLLALEGEKNVLQGKDIGNGNSILISVAKSATTRHCSQQILYQATIEGVKVPVCRNKSNNIYVAIFQKGANWHNIGIFGANLSEPPSEAAVKEIVNSIKVQ